MARHAAQVICACMVGADGLTPVRRLEGGASWAHRGQVSVKARVAHGPDSGKSEQVQSEVHRGEVIRILPQVIPLHFGKFRREVSHAPNDQESQR